MINEPIPKTPPPSRPIINHCPKHNMKVTIISNHLLIEKKDIIKINIVDGCNKEPKIAPIR